MAERTIIVGVGNPYRSDDAVGVVVAERIEKRLGPRGDVEYKKVVAHGIELMELMKGSPFCNHYCFRRRRTYYNHRWRKHNKYR